MNQIKNLNQNLKNKLDFSANEERLYICDLPLLTVGEITAGDGESVNFTEDFLRAAAGYNNAQFPNRVPYLILGHVDETWALMSDTVYGDVREFEFRDGTLYANKCVIFKDKENEVESGKFQGVSVRVSMETGEIYHVAFVGRQAVPKANVNNAKIKRFDEFQGEDQGGNMADKNSTTDLSENLNAKILELEALNLKYQERMQKLEEENKKTKAVSFIKDNQTAGNILESQVEIVAKMFTAENVESVLQLFEEFIKLNKKVDFSQTLPGGASFKENVDVPTKLTDEIVEEARKKAGKVFNSNAN